MQRLGGGGGVLGRLHNGTLRHLLAVRGEEAPVGQHPASRSERESK